MPVTHGVASSSLVQTAKIFSENPSIGKYGLKDFFYHNVLDS